MTATAARQQGSGLAMEAKWSLRESPPDLQELVLAHGGFDRITPEAWLAYDRALAEWRSRTAVGDFHRWPYR